MTKEITKRHNRLLQAECRFGKTAIEIWQRECKSRCAMKEKTPEYYKFLNWEPKENEIALFTLYSSYKELSIPHSYDCIFNFYTPSIMSKVKMELTQIIWEAWHPVDKMIGGHKHLSIFKHQGGIPSLITELHLEENKFSTTPKNNLLLGICKMEDYDAIKNRIETIMNLKEKYGANWGDYFDED